VACAARSAICKESILFDWFHGQWNRGLRLPEICPKPRREVMPLQQLL
jgi:hypothetical protein